MIDFRRLNEQLDSLAVVRRLGLEIAWVFATYVRLRCPFHDSRSGRSFDVSRLNRHCYCHSRECHWRGDLIDLTAAVLGCSLVEAARRLKEEFRL
jgi:hypothetical protein